VQLLLSPADQRQGYHIQPVFKGMFQLQEKVHHLLSAGDNDAIKARRKAEAVTHKLNCTVYAQAGNLQFVHTA
jgi:hypothetical protein